MATPPVSIPSDLSDTESSGNSSRSGSGCGSGWSKGYLDHAPTPSPPPPSLSRVQGSHGISGRTANGKGQLDHTPSPPLSSGLYGVSDIGDKVWNQESDSEFPETILEKGGVDWHSDNQSTPPSPSPPAIPAGMRPPRFWYIDHEGGHVLDKDCAAVSFNGKGSSKE